MVKIKNRIVKQGMVKWKDLSWFQPRNLKELTASQKGKIKQSLCNNGFLMPFSVWDRAGELFILDGHIREFAMQEMEAEGIEIDPLLPANFIACKSEAEAVKIVLVFNSHYASINAEVLREFASEVSADELSTEIEIPNLKVTLDHDADVVEVESTEVPAEPISRLGDLYTLESAKGVQHRILCGDSVNFEDVARLLGGRKVSMVFTDPPYGIDYDQGSRPKESKRKKRPAKFEKIANDAVGPLRFLPGVFRNMTSAMHEGAVYYVWHAPKTQMMFEQALLECGLHLSQAIIWGKGHFAFGRLDYHMQHEVCFYGWKGKGHGFYGERNQSSVWDVLYDNGNRSAGHDTVHPNQKPVQLSAIAIANSSLPGEIILDLFLGSGSTLLAAEQLGRSCYGIELAPKYVDVLVQRWVDLTGVNVILRNGEAFEWPAKKSY